jgi:hypothetical membrane protein
VILIPPKDKLISAALRLGITVPFLYYGLQLLAAPFYPHFSFVRTTASELGSDLSPCDWIFNIGIIIEGVVTLIAAVGFLRAFWRLGARRVLALLASIAVAINGFQCLWAGLHPLPDPRHGGHTVVVIAMVLLPILLTATMWRLSDSRLLKTYLIATLVLLAAMFPIMSGLTGIDRYAYRGLLQRVFTLTVFPPIGVAAYVLAKRMKALPTKD